MLTRLQYNILTQHLRLCHTVDELEVYKSMTPGGKVEFLTAFGDERLFDFPADSYPEYALAAFITESTTVKKTPTALEVDAIAADLGIIVNRAPIVWTKPKPPTTYPSLLAKWPEEAALIGAMAAKLDFNSLESPMYVVLAVQEALGLGGFLDALTRLQISVSEPTMQLFALGIDTHLRAVRRDWYQTDSDADDAERRLPELPNNVSGISKEQEDWEIDYANRLRRRDVARANAKKRNEEKLEAIKGKRQAAFTQIELVPAAAEMIKVVSTKLSMSSFDEVTSFVQTTTKQDVGDTWLPTSLLKQLKGVLAFTSESDVRYTEEYLLAELCKLLPSWFIELQDGSLKLRKTPYVARVATMDRATKSLYRQLDALTTRYGADVVGDALLTMAGKTPSWAALVAHADEASKADEA